MKKTTLFICLLIAPAICRATVTLSTATWSGPLSYASTVTITCAGAGAKPVQARTYCFANFENLSAGVVPSTWSVATTFSNNSHISTQTTHCFNGSGCVGNDVDMSGQSNFAASIDIPDVGAGGKLMMSVEWYRDGTDWPTSGASNVYNIKTYRFWASRFKLNDLYGGQQTDGGFINFNENDNGFATTGNDRVFTNRLRPPLGSHEQVEWYIQLNSDASTNSTDGQFIVNQGGVNRVNNSTWRSHTSSDASNGRYRLAFPIHMVYANGTFPSSNIRYDNVVVDTGWCAVWVTTVSTNMLSATKYFLPVISWSNTQVQVAFAQKLTGNTSYYLYVQDNSRNVNASGLSVLTSAAGGGSPSNTAPVPDAGTDQTITLPSTASLSGSDSDDGLPSGTVTFEWSKLSGPGSVTFVDSTALSTTATFSASGTYVLRLTADDSDLQGTSDVTITVNPAPSTSSGKTFKWKRRG